MPSKMIKVAILPINNKCVYWHLWWGSYVPRPPGLELQKIASIGLPVTKPTRSRTKIVLVLHTKKLLIDTT